MRYRAAFHGIGIISLGLVGLTLVAQDRPVTAANTGASSAVAQTSDKSAGLDYTTNWIANTLPGDGSGNYAQRHIPINMQGMYVTDNGSVYTNTGWDEGGRAVSIFRDGKLVSPISGNAGGPAIVVSGSNLFASQSTGTGSNPPCSQGGCGVQILDATSLQPNGRALNSTDLLLGSTGSPNITGMAVWNGNVYIGIPDENVVDVFNASTLVQVNQFPIANAARIAVDSRGGMWISHRDPTPLPLAPNRSPSDLNGRMGLPTIDHYDAQGNWINSISLPAGGQAGAIWIDRHGLLLVGDDGPEQNIKIYGNLQHDPTLLTTIGVPGGNYAGNTDQRGTVGPLRFRGIEGLGTDSLDNLYVAESGFGFDTGNGHGVELQAYDWLGNLKWNVYGLSFISTAGVDPRSQTDAYDAYHHFTMDYDKRGNLGTYVADTYSRFLYPDDLRVTNYGSTAQVRYIQNRKFLMVANQPGVAMELYRFDDSRTGPGKEIAIPSVAFDCGSFQGAMDFDIQPVDGEFIWRDSNGDGQMSLDEIIEPPNNTHRDGNDFWLDTNGDIWQVNYNSQIEGSIHLRRYLFQGFDSFGNPIYDYNHMIIYSAPADFPDFPGGLQAVMFDPDKTSGGTLYVAGNGIGGVTNFQQIVRYDHWDKGERKGKWTINVPWNQDPNNTWDSNSFTENDDFLFVDFNTPHLVQVYSSATGNFVGELDPGNDVGGPAAVGNDDEWRSLASSKLPNGKYIIFKEEDYQNKNLVYQWTPPETLPPPPVIPAPTGVQGVANDDAVTPLQWNAVPGAFNYNVYEATSPQGPYTLLYNGVTGNSATIPGLQNGQTYYITVTALTETGMSPPSTPIAVTPVAYGTSYEFQYGTFYAPPGNCPPQLFPAPLDSGGVLVGCVVPGDTITLSNVNVGQTGNYAVRLYYDNGDNTPTDLYSINVVVNGGASITSPNLPYTGPNWNVPGYVTYSVPLNAGNNVLVFGNPADDTAGIPNLDRIVVPPAP